MESAVLIHPALGFLLTVLPRALTCPNLPWMSALSLPNPCPTLGQSLGHG